MHYQLYDIHPLLKPYVKTICVMDSDESEASLVPMRVLPDACVELFVNFYEPQQVAAPGAPSAHGRSFLTSRMNTFMDVQTRGRVGFVSVCFTDGFAYPFFPLSMHHVANHVIDLRDVWGDSADALQALVEGARTVDQRVQLVQQYLINRLQQATRFDKAVTYCVQEIKRANGLLSVEELACRVGLSNRHLVRLFSQCIGISPKEFARMATFLQALKQLKQYPTLTLTEVAYESGYYDQAHFIHACRQYSGLSPTQLIATYSVLY